MRLLVATCEVEYSGRLGASLAPAKRLLLFKADGSISIHADSGAYKPLNWMNPPCTIIEEDGNIRVRNPKGDALLIKILEIHDEVVTDLGADPGLVKDGVEAEMQVLIAKRVAALEDDFELVRREFPTDIGPVDLLCRDGSGQAVAVEVKRVGEIAGVDQLLRYLERLNLDPGLAPVRGMFVAERIKPQAKVYAESRDIAWKELPIPILRDELDDELRLF
ncbi:MAG: endonuclease NucS [Acidimicrobiia bacterium]|nr:endonuclease NucS [Acidimicrobiia bacterium]MBP8180703.1 endonuclease NucS [Acidimicrobiia bacterium]